MKNIWVLLIMFALASCAHESTISPSQGHIDDQQAYKPSSISTAEIPKPVKSNAFVPPPKPKAKEQTYSVVVNEVPVKEILFALARESKLNIDIHPAIQGRVTLNAVDQTLPAILERLSKQLDLTYKIEGNVLSITPDQPILRSYRVDYVNMSRDTTGSVGVASEIASTGRAASTGGAGGSSSGGTTNSSRTLVSSESKNHFWATLISNLKDILAETDKEVIITRTGNTAQSETKPVSATAAGQAATAVPPTSAVPDAQAIAQEREEMRAEYKTLFAATVIANPEAGIINVRGTSKQHERVQEFLDQVMTSVKRQVLIEATIVEVQLSDTYQAGIDWSRLNNVGHSGFQFEQTLGPNASTDITTGRFVGAGRNAFGTLTTAGIVAGYFNPAGSLGNIAASITLLKQFGETKVLSSPKLMVLNNQTAVLKVVNNLVYFTIESEVTPATIVGAFPIVSVTTTPHTVPVGVVMSVTPQINDADTVNINVRPTISRVLSFIPDPNRTEGIAESLIPQIQVQEMESMLQINSGSTAVLGGLMQDEIQRNTDKVPGLSKLPGIGKIFTGKNDANRKTELVIFLKPTVIRNASLESDELLSYKQYLPTPQLQQTADEPAN